MFTLSIRDHRVLEREALAPSFNIGYSVSWMEEGKTKNLLSCWVGTKGLAYGDSITYRIFLRLKVSTVKSRLCSSATYRTRCSRSAKVLPA